MPTDATRSTSAELSAITDNIERQRDRVAALAEPYLGTERADIVSTLHESERQLLMATRALRRALRALDSVEF